MPSLTTEELYREHDVILPVLAALDRQVRAAEGSGKAPTEFLKQLVRFSRTYIDKCHHGKEEGCLFPCLERRGMPRDSGPIGVMLQEHVEGRALVARIEETVGQYEAGEVSADVVLQPCRDYLELLGGHIRKENEILYPIGDSVMGEEDHGVNRECYGKRLTEIGPAVPDEMVALAKQLAEGG